MPVDQPSEKGQSTRFELKKRATDLGLHEEPGSLWVKAEQTLTEEDRDLLKFDATDKGKIAQEVLLLAKEKQEACVRKSWKYTRENGNVIELRTVITNVTTYVERFIKVGDAISSYDQSHFALPWAGVKLLLQFAIGDNTIYASVVDGLEVVSYNLELCARVERERRSRNNEDRKLVDDLLTNTYASILIFLSRARKYFKKATARRVLEGIITTPEVAVAQYVRQIEQHQRRILDFTQIADGALTRNELYHAHVDITGRIDQSSAATNAKLQIIGEDNSLIRIQQGTMIAQAASVIEAKQREEILAWIDDKTTGPRRDCQDALSDMLHGTCRWLWLCSEYTSWLSDDDNTSTARFFWLYGPPGFGKTVISAATIENLSMQSKVAYFFCKNQDPVKRQPTSILRSWIDQLVRNDEELLQCASEFYNKGDKPPAIITDLWFVLTSIVQRRTNCILVVDGFDECEDTDVTDTYHQTGAKTKFLMGLTKALQETCCKVLLVSRHTQNLQSFWTDFQASEGNQCFFSREISVNDTAADVISYSRVLFDNKLHNKKLEDRKTISDDVVRKCEGSFLWVRLVGAQLKAGHNTKTLLGMVQQTPPGLDGAYDRDIRSIKNLQPDDKARAFSILKWVSYARRPLSVAELTEALIAESVEKNQKFPKDELPDAWDDDYVKDRIFDLCGSFLKMKSDGLQGSYEKSTIEFVHFSGKEYLLEHQQLAGSEFSNWSEQDLGTTCLRYLLLKDFNFGRRILTSETGRLLDDYAFLEYASTFWHVHLRGSVPPMDLHHLVNQLFEPEEGRWYTWAAIIEKPYQDLDDDHPEAQGSALYYCSFLGLGQIAFKLLGQGSQVNEVGGYYGTPLQAAVFEGHTEMVRLLLHYSADVNLEGGRHGFPIVAVAANPLNTGREEILQLLLSYGAKVSSSEYGTKNVALHYAATTGAVGFAQRLVTAAKEEASTDDVPASAAVNPANNLGWTPLHAAAQAGDIGIIKLFVESQVELEVEENRGWTPLFTAAAYGNLDAVRYLKEKNARPDVRDHSGWTTAHAAAESGSVPIFEYLMSPMNSIGFGINELNGQKSTALHGAALGGHSHMVEYLIKEGATVDIGNENGWTALHAAAWNGHDTIIDLLLGHGANLEQEDNKGWRPLHLAAQRGHPTSVDLLLKRNAELSPVSHNSWTPLHNACAFGEYLVTEILLSLNPDLDLVDDQGETPLILAARKHNERIVKELIGKGASVNAKDKLGFSAMHFAVFSELLSLVKPIVEKGGDVNASSTTGLTPIHVAAIQGDLSVLEYLLDKGAKVDTPDEEGLLPVHLAALSGHTQVIKILVAKGANVRVATVKGHTPLHDAASLGHLQAVISLLENDADIDARETDGSTPLYLSAFCGHEEVVTYLLDKNADAGIPTDTGLNPLLVSSHEGHLSIVKLLVELEAASSSRVQVDINVRAKNGSTPLYYSAINGHEEVVAYLLGKKADLRIATHTGWTPLLASCQEGHLPVVKLLVEYGAQPNDTTEDGRTSLIIAMQSKHVEIMRYLLSRGANPDCNTHEGLPAIYITAETGSTEMTALLASRGADVDRKTPTGFTSLYVASLNGYFDVVDILLANGAKAQPSNGDEFLPLYAAASRGYVKIVNLLISHGADAKLARSDGFTPLFVTASEGHLEVVKCLLGAGADINVKSPNESTPLHAAASAGHTDIVEYLLGRGAKDLVTQAENSALMASADFGHLKIVEFLLASGADPCMTDTDGWSPLLVAIQRGHLDVAKALFSGGPNIQERMTTGIGALHLAAMGGKVEIVEWLLDLGLDPNAVNADGRTPLYEIANAQTADTETITIIDPDGKESAPPSSEWNVSSEDVSAVITCLIDGGVNLNHIMQRGRTALHVAAVSGNLGALEELLKQGADPDISDDFQTTPLHCAIYAGFSQCLALLMKFGASTDMLDGYGRSSLDWAALYEPQFQKMRASTDGFAPTPLDIRVECLQNSVRFLAQALLDQEEDWVTGYYHELGHCLMFQGHLEDARFAFEQQILEVSSDGTVIHQIICNLHRNDLIFKGTRFVCKTCPDVDLCSVCMAQYKKGSVIGFCHGHEFLEIGNQQGDDQRLARKSSEATKDWLRTLLVRTAWTGR